MHVSSATVAPKEDPPLTILHVVDAAVGLETVMAPDLDTGPLTNRPPFGCLHRVGAEPDQKLARP